MQKKPSFEPDEFQLILSTVTSLRENNEQLRSIQQKTKYSVTESCLNELITEHYTDSPTLMEEKMDYLGLHYLKTEKLCMAVFKIDNYHSFITEHSLDELWELRFAAVNIIEELVAAKYTCNGFNRDNDKFVLILSCSNETDLVDFEDRFVLLLQSIQNTIEAHLHFTVSITYNTNLPNIGELPIIYKQLETSLLLKMRLGHAAIIDPHLIDEIRPEPFQCSYKATNQLIDYLIQGKLDKTLSLYQEIVQDLFYCDYAEIHSTLFYLIHSIYERLSEKYPMLKDIFVEAMKKFISRLEYAEVSDDILMLSRNYFETICNAVQKSNDNPQQQNSIIIAKKVSDIIQQRYSEHSLCTSISKS